MYPTIQQAECPRCGSTRKEPLGADSYRCADCGMHYHLDWAEARVQVRQPTGPLPSPTARWNWLPLKALLAVVMAMLLLAGLSFWAAAVHVCPVSQPLSPAQALEGEKAQQATHLSGHISP